LEDLVEALVRLLVLMPEIELQKSVISMLKAALMPSTWTYELDLGLDYSAKSIGMDNFLEESEHVLPSSTDAIYYTQAPQMIPPLHHYSHKSIYFLLNITERSPPTKVTVRATNNNGETRTLDLPVLRTATSSDTIHHLAAKAAVLDLESHSDHESQPLARRNAERLGEIYSIPSKWTSFLAVDQVTQDMNVASCLQGRFK
jgi:hypothetical protein